MNEIYTGREHESSVASLREWLLSTVPFIQMASRRLQSSNVEILEPLVLLFPGFSSVQSSPSVMSDSLWPHGLQHARSPYPSPTHGVCSNSCPLSQWCNPNISSSVDPFSSCLQSFPASESFPMSQFFASGGQIIGVLASASVPMNIQDWFPLGLTGFISLQSKELSGIFSCTTIQ